MLEAVVVVAVALVLAGAGLRAFSWTQRRRALARLDGSTIVRIERGVGMRILVEGPPFAGMNPRRANRTRGDLALTADRFVWSTGRGLFVDIGAERGRRFSSVRCTGPGRLIIEGDVPHPSGRAGKYRAELFTEQATQWAEALQDFVRPPEEGEAVYAVKPAELPS